MVVTRYNCTYNYLTMNAINDLMLDDIHIRWGAVVNAIKQEYLSEEQIYPWIIGFSGGKDSTVVVHAVFEALLELPPSKRLRAVHVVSNDTLVESPLVVTHLVRSQNSIKIAAESWGLPITVATTRPSINQTFWILLIGKGYPSPNQTMRWCTDRLKIAPTSQYILDRVSSAGAAIVVLGVRIDESDSRRNVIHKWKNLYESNLAPHSELPGAFIYRPIVDMTTEDIWEVLGTFSPPWGGSHTGLIQLYRDAEGGECPVVLSKSEAPGCGTASSRFGCWTCTVVDKDRSLQGFVDSGNHEYMPLIDFRDWLKEIRNNPTYRSVERRNGQVQFDLTGKHIPGPFTIQARQMILKKLLDTQKNYGNELISTEEIDIIKSIWAHELSKMTNRR